MHFHSPNIEAIITSLFLSQPSLYASLTLFRPLRASVEEHQPVFGEMNLRSHLNINASMQDSTKSIYSIYAKWRHDLIKKTVPLSKASQSARVVVTTSPLDVTPNGRSYVGRCHFRGSRRWLNVIHRSNQSRRCFLVRQ